MGSRAGPCYGAWLLDSMESLRDCMKMAQNLLSRERKGEHSFTHWLSTTMGPFLPTDSSSPALRVVHACMPGVFLEVPISASAEKPGMGRNRH